MLLLKDGRLVKTIKFKDYRDVGNPVTTAKIYDAQRADELMFLDIAAGVENRRTLFDIVKVVSEECFMPLGVGGGIRSLEDIRLLLRGGADKVVINTAAVEQPGFITAAAEKFGCSTVVVSIDFRRHQDGRAEAVIRGGRQLTGLEPVAWAMAAVAAGAGEILITSVDRDGTMQGLDIPLIRAVVDAVAVPVICSGGVGSLEDFKNGFSDGGAAAVGAGSIFHFTDQSIIKTRRYLVGEGIAVRP